MRTRIQTTYELADTDLPMVVVYEDDKVGLLAHDLSMTIRFVAAQIPMLEQLLTALIAKRDKAVA